MECAGETLVLEEVKEKSNVSRRSIFQILLLAENSPKTTGDSPNNHK